MTYKKIYLRPGKEIPVKRKHRWIFSGAISHGDRFEDGEILQVYSSENILLGHGYCNNKTTICCRMINFDNTPPLISLEENIANAVDIRKSFFDESITNAYRIINGEGDFIPGLIVDRYNDVLVLQIATIGIDRIKDKILEMILKTTNNAGLKINAVYEKSTMSARAKDGLKPFEGVLYGKLNEQVEIFENGIKFIVNIANSQKTGLFLDQREMRKLVGDYSNKKRVLNCFGYTGGFSLYALKGGAVNVTTLDIAKDAIEQAKINFVANKFNVKENQFFVEDAFTFLRENKLEYDLIILDPPAFAKKKEDLDRAMRGYADINRTTISKMLKGSLLLTCSCSYHLSLDNFEDIVKKAALNARRSARIISRHRIAGDHPLNLFHSEIDYLKGLLLLID